MKVTVAATQFACTNDRAANLASAERLIRDAAGRGANVVLIQELFETPYFCKEHNADWFKQASSIEENPAVRRFQQLARELKVVLPASVFERAGNAFYNTVAMIDADGSVLGIYRKAHIPESPGYHEKFFFSPGDTGFKVWPTRYGTLGVAICWDQWFPESARAMAVQGAEILFYPTAIGSEPQDLSIDSRDHWQRAMQGHSASNVTRAVVRLRLRLRAAGPQRDPRRLAAAEEQHVARRRVGRPLERAQPAVLVAQVLEAPSPPARRSRCGGVRAQRVEHAAPSAACPRCRA